MKDKTEKILVTGAAGLLGSHLVDALLIRGYQVSGVDNLSIGAIENLDAALRHPGFCFHQFDVLDSESLRRLDVHDVVVHMAAYKIEVPGLHGTDILEINTRGTSNMLTIARSWNAKFIFSSTSDVYGKNVHMPFHEGLDLVIGPSDVPRWGYAASKIFDEHLCFAFHRRFGLPVVVLRYFNTYGPRHELSPRSGGPQALFFDSILTHKKLTIHGDGTQQRCFAFVDDSIEMTVRAIEADEALGEIINIGNPDNEIRIVDLADLACQTAGLKRPFPIQMIPHEVAYKTNKFEEVQRRIPDISKAQKLLGFTPEISNEEGMQRTFQWQSQLKCYDSKL